MIKIRSICLSLSLVAGLCGTALAAPPVGTGGGYYGSAWYDSSQGSVVGPYSTWSACNTALQNGIHNATVNFGWTMVTYNPCSYRPPFGYASPYELGRVGMVVSAGSPGESAGVAKIISGEISQLRSQYGADDYEKALDAIYHADDSKITDPNNDPESSSPVGKR